MSDRYPARRQQHRLGCLRYLPWRRRPAQYKDYILVMLFLKYISDLWQDHYETYRQQYGDDDERIRRKLDRERFTLPFVEFKDEKPARSSSVSPAISTACTIDATRPTSAS